MMLLWKKKGKTNQTYLCTTLLDVWKSAVRLENPAGYFISVSSGFTASLQQLITPELLWAPNEVHLSLRKKF